MRKVIVFVNLTLDGYLSGQNGELDWMLSRPDEKMNPEFTDAMRERVDTILTGRNFHFGIEQNFRAQAADPASPPGLVEFANWMVNTPRVVFSSTLTDVAQNITVAADIAKQVTALKALPGKDMVLFGGNSTTQQFVEHDLVDEYWIKLYPVSIGAGQPLFRTPVDLTLIDSTTYDSGIITLRYRPA
jgi:dihydrofolate reductase